MFSASVFGKTHSFDLGSLSGQRGAIPPPTQVRDSNWLCLTLCIKISSPIYSVYSIKYILNHHRGDVWKVNRLSVGRQCEESHPVIRGHTFTFHKNFLVIWVTAEHVKTSQIFTMEYLCGWGSLCVSDYWMCVLSIRVVVTIKQTEEDIQKAVSCIKEAASAVLKWQ